MADPISSIVTEATLGQINDALMKAEAALKEVDLAKRAGIDVSAQEAALQDGINKLQRIKQTYFPNAVG